MTLTLAQLRAGAQRALADAGDAARRESRLIVERVTGLEGSELAEAWEQPVTPGQVARCEAMVERRRLGEPLQYVLGSWGFRTLDLYLDARVLIPRPETEVVVGYALAEIERCLGGRGEPSTVVDLGTGSGAIALSIAAEQVRAEVWATEASAEALCVARANLAGLGRPARRVRMLEGDWFSPLPPELAGRVDVVVANPPYVAGDQPLRSEVADWEPSMALVPGPTGLEAYERIVPEVPRWLGPSGALVVEIGDGQAEAVTALAEAAGFGDVTVHPDLAGRHRVVVAR